MFEKEVPLKKITDVKDKNMFSKSILIISVSLFLRIIDKYTNCDLELFLVLVEILLNFDTFFPRYIKRVVSRRKKIRFQLFSDS